MSTRIPPPKAARDSRTIETILHTLFFVALSALTLGYILPTMVARVSGVYFHDDMLKTMTNQGFVTVVENDIEYTNHRKLLESQVEAIDNAALQATFDQRTALLATRSNYIHQLEHEAPPVTIQEFSGHIVLYFWPVMYLCLGCVAFVFGSSRPGASPRIQRKSWRAIGKMGLTLFLFQITPLWFRNYFLTDARAGRVLYAYPNQDISPAAFVMQNINYLAFALLLALIWERSSLDYSQRQRKLVAADAMNPLEFLADPHSQCDFVALQVNLDKMSEPERETFTA